MHYLNSREKLEFATLFIDINLGNTIHVHHAEIYVYRLAISKRKKYGSLIISLHFLYKSAIKI